MTLAITIRPETEADYASITHVNDMAFDRPNEGILVKNLRKLDEFVQRLSLVAEFDGKIIGHVILYPVKIQVADNEYVSLSLGPIAVIPEYQKQGLGGQLVKAGHEAAIELGYSSVVVLGHPTYYPRFGYQPASNWGLTNSWEIFGDAWMAIELSVNALDNKAGKVIYPEAFNEAT